MKIIIILLALVSCGPKSSKETLISNETINLASQTIEASLVDGNVSLPNVFVDLSEVAQGQKTSSSIFIKNATNQAIVFNNLDFVTNDIQPIQINNACLNITLARSRTCKIEFSLSNQSAINQNEYINKNINIKNAQINIQGTLLANASSNQNIVVNSSHLDFGTMKLGSSKTLNVIITDKKGLSSLTIPNSSDSNISITNNCPSSISRNRSCSISVTYTANGESVSNLSFLSIFGQNLTYSANIDSQAQMEQINIIPQSTSLNLNITEPNINNYSIRFINKSNKSISTPISVQASHSGININSVQCSGGLLRNRYCSINFSLNSNILPEGLTNQTIKLVSTSIESQSLQLSINVAKQCSNDNIRYEEQCVPQSAKWSDYYDLSCNCYKNVPYIENDNISWTIDNGFINNNIVNRSLNLYLPQNPNGELIVFAHPVGETKEMNSSFSQPLLAALLQEGYAVSSIEFRHPIMERAIISNVIQDQWDLILALKMIRKNLNFIGITNSNNISAIAHSKGSLILANLLNSNSHLSDNQGFISLKKLYLYDSQITYNLDTHYNLFTGTNINPICYLNLGFGCMVGPFSPYQALVYFNDMFDSAGGMALTTNLNVVDSYRSVTDNSLMNNLNNTRQLPIIKFAFNQPNVGKRSPQYLINSDLSLNYPEVDYLIHNPLSIDAFCSQYNNYVTNGCSGNSSFSFNINSALIDILNFF